MILNEILTVIQNSKNIAYTENGTSYSYAEFYQYICNLYHFLIKNNQEKKPVVVYGGKEIWVKAAFLACSFAGMAYVPIDKSTPAERVESIINQVNPKIVLGDSRSVSLEEITEMISQKNIEEISEIAMNPEDIDYIIFTSGTTGVPKGVKVTYENLDSCITWLKKVVGSDYKTILNQANFSFDLSVADLYLSLMNGSEQFILESNKLDFPKIFNSLKKSNADLAICTPSFVDLLLMDKNFNQELLPRLRMILFCGEKLTTNTVKKLYERFDNMRVINCYGPTECTFAVTSVEITKEMLNMDILPVGVSKDDVTIAIVNENLEKCDKGEILISGKSVAAGYCQSESKSFIQFDGKRSYLTGDLGYFRNGNLYCLGRKDNQVKYKGYRIELEDIEENIYQLQYVEKAKVLAKNDDEKVTKIIAYIQLKYEKKKEEIRKDLQKVLPEYMIPNIKIIEKFPMNSNGKIDVQKLRSL